MSKELTPLEQAVMETAWEAWKYASNSFMLHPEKKHTFSNYWNDYGLHNTKVRFGIFKDNQSDTCHHCEISPVRCKCCGKILNK